MVGFAANEKQTLGCCLCEVMNFKQGGISGGLLVMLCWDVTQVCADKQGQIYLYTQLFTYMPPPLF